MGYLMIQFTGDRPTLKKEKKFAFRHIKIAQSMNGMAMSE